MVVRGFIVLFSLAVLTYGITPSAAKLREMFN